MRTRISTSLVAAALALPLLAGCGAGSGSAAPEGSSAPASTAAAPSSSAASSSAPSATPTSDPAAEEDQVIETAKDFVTAAFGFSSDQSYADYQDRLEPLMMKKALSSFEKADLEAATKTFKTRFGGDARTKTKFLGALKVTGLKAESATATVKYENRIEVRRGGSWKTVQTSPEDTAKISMVKQDGRWLVDDL